MAAAITSIDFDHQELLGETLESIAREKAGVIKPGIPVIVGPVAPGARAVIETTCRERGARLVDAAERVARRRRELAAAMRRRSRSRPANIGSTDVTLGAAGTPSDRQRRASRSAC